MTLGKTKLSVSLGIWHLVYNVWTFFILLFFYEHMLEIGPKISEILIVIFYSLR